MQLFFHTSYHFATSYYFAYNHTVNMIKEFRGALNGFYYSKGYA